MPDADPTGPLEGRAEASSTGRIRATAGWAFVVYALSAGLRLVYQVGYARMLGVVEFGRFMIALNWALLLAPASTLGYSVTVLALVPVYESTGQAGYLRGLVRRARRTALGVGVGILAVAGGAALVLSDDGASLALGFVLVPLLGILLVNQELLRALRRQIAANVLALLVQPSIAIALAVLIVVVADLTAVRALAAYAVAGILVAWAGGRLASRVETFPSPGTPVSEDRPRWVKTSRSLFITSMFQRVIYQADLVVVGLVAGPAEAGLYAAALRLASASSLITEAVNSIVAPELARLHALGDRERLQQVVDSAVRLSFFPALALFVPTVVLAGPLLSLFGDSFEAASTVLVVLAVGNLVNAATGPCGYLLALTGNERVSARIAGVHAVANVVLCFALVAAFGRNGAAIATAAVFASLNLTAQHKARQLVGVASYPRGRWLLGRK